uniref:Uncharacterized protein n=1 Tax=Triticum urartu TaxID=4572 RepID=A0A8R7TZM4_TRIUA
MHLLFLVGVDDAVRPGVGDAGEHVALGHLRVVQERPVRLVHLAGRQLPRARRARPGPARVGQLHAGLLRRVQDVGVLRHLQLRLRAIGPDELHLVRRRRRPEPGRQPRAARRGSLRGGGGTRGGPDRLRRGGKRWHAPNAGGRDACCCCAQSCHSSKENRTSLARVPCGRRSQLENRRA